jgi:hypothetical protein
MNELIGSDFTFGHPEYIRSKGIPAPAVGLVFTPTALGVDLYLWALGKGAQTLDSFLDPTDIYETPAEIIINVGATLVADLPPTEAPLPTPQSKPSVPEPE